MRITRKLNIIHSIHFSLLLTFIFVIHFFILKEVNKDLLLRQARNHAANIEQIIYQHLQHDAVLKKNRADEIDTKTIKEKGDFQFLDAVQIQRPFKLILLGPDKSILYCSDSLMRVDSNIIAQQFFQHVIELKSIKKSPLFLNDETKYFAAVHSVQLPMFYLIVAHPHTALLKDMGNYPLIITILYLIVLIILLMMVIRTNYKYTRPVSQIVENIHRAHPKVKNNQHVDEAIIIQRFIDSLQNQMEFYIKNLEKSKSEYQKFNRDLEIARKLQSNILPKQVPEIVKRIDFDIDAHSEAAFDLGGDFYDYFLIDEQKLVFMIGDIAGKGIPASLYMIFTHTLLRSIVNKDSTVAEIVGKLNNRLIEESVSDLFITMIIGILDTETGNVEYCNAAHNYPILVRANGEIEELSDTHGIPLGIYSNRVYSTSTIKLSHNDQLFLFTDGLVEIKDENNMYFSVEVLKYNLMGAWFLIPTQVITKIRNDVKLFRGNVDPADDMTMLMLKYHQLGQTNQQDVDDVNSLK